jgi:putative transposase
MNSPEWISAKDLAQLQGVTVRAIRKAIKENRLIARTIEADKGQKYEIFIPSLKADVQKLIKFEKKPEDIEKTQKQVCEKKIIPDRARQIALARYDLVKLWEEYRDGVPNKTKAGQDFIELYNAKHLYQEIYKTLGNVSIGTIYRWSKSVRAKESWQPLVPSYNYGTNEIAVNLTREEELIFMNLLLSPNKTNIGKATRLTKFILKKKGIDSPNSERNFRRYAENFKRRNYDQWVLAREGQKALRDKVEPYILRDPSKLNVGDVLVADGHRLSFQVINPFTGRPCRAVLVGYLDWKSFGLCGFEIMLEENTQCIASALRNSILFLGKMPLIIYQDNGNAFRAKFFTGDFRESGLNGLFSNLGIVPVFATPYNARAKIIERFFKEFQDSFERLLPSFVGSSIADKPAYMLRNEPFHKALHHEFIPTIEETVKLVHQWLEFHYDQACPHVKGKTIGEVLNEGRGSSVNINDLDDLMLAQEIKTIHRNGIRFLKADYYNECLYGLREKVMIKYSLFNLSKVRVYSLQGEFLCEAERVMPVHPMAKYLGDPQDLEELKHKIKEQRRLEKQTIQEVKGYLLGDSTKPVDWQNPQEIRQRETTKLLPQNDLPESVDSNNRPSFEYNYQRYEWHLINGFDTEEDQHWFNKYRQTTEFKEIYGELNNEKSL